MMIPTGLIEAVVDNTETTSAITPYLPLIGTIFGGMVIGAFAVWNRRRGATESRQPDVNELWMEQRALSKELDMERRWRRAVWNFADELTRVFRGYVRRVQGGGVVELTDRERIFHDADPPSGEIRVTPIPPTQ